MTKNWTLLSFSLPSVQSLIFAIWKVIFKNISLWLDYVIQSEKEHVSLLRFFSWKPFSLKKKKKKRTNSVILSKLPTSNMWFHWYLKLELISYRLLKQVFTIPGNANADSVFKGYFQILKLLVLPPFKGKKLHNIASIVPGWINASSVSLCQLSNF